MTREVAIKAIQDFIGWFKEDSLIRKALEMAIKALEQEPTEKPMTVDEMEREYEKSKALFHKIVECDDAISREAIRKILARYHLGESMIAEELNELPSVTQKGNVKRV